MAPVCRLLQLAVIGRSQMDDTSLLQAQFTTLGLKADKHVKSPGGQAPEEQSRRSRRGNAERSARGHMSKVVPGTLLDVGASELGQEDNSMAAWHWCGWHESDKNVAIANHDYLGDLAAEQTLCVNSCTDWFKQQNLSSGCCELDLARSACWASPLGSPREASGYAKEIGLPMPGSVLSEPVLSEPVLTPKQWCGHNADVEWIDDVTASGDITDEMDVKSMQNSCVDKCKVWFKDVAEIGGCCELNLDFPPAGCCYASSGTSEEYLVYAKFISLPELAQ